MSKTIHIFLFLLLSFSSLESYSAKKNELALLTSFLTSGEVENSRQLFKRTDKSDFKHEDIVYYFANFTWENIEKSGGRHKVLFKWYSNGKAIGAPKWSGTFKTAPWEVRSTMYASTLGYGNHKIEMYLDGKLVDTKEFRVIK